MKIKRTINFITLLILPLILGFGQCNTPDDIVIVTYQHLANFQKWNLSYQINGYWKLEQGASPDGMWHVYMLRGIVNKGKNAKPFDFDIRNLTNNAGDNIDSVPQAMQTARMLEVVTPLDFKTTVQPQQVFTIPTGEGVLFFIHQKDDIEKTAVTTLSYKSGSKEIRALPAMLNQTAEVMFDVLTNDFLNQIQAKQKEYENAYDPEGKKK